MTKKGKKRGVKKAKAGAQWKKVSERSSCFLELEGGKAKQLLWVGCFRRLRVGEEASLTIFSISAR